MTPSERCAFVSGLKAAVRMLYKHSRALQLKGSIACANGVAVGALVVEARIQRESRKLKAKGKRR